MTKPFTLFPQNRRLIIGTLSGISLLPLLVGLGAMVVRMPGRSYAGPFEPLTPAEETSRAALEGHVRVLAGDIGQRNMMTYAALEKAANYIEGAFMELGYQVSAQQFEADGHTVRNLEVFLPGQTWPEEIIIVGAHYDTVYGCPGANDNASGVAAVLELARLLAAEPLGRTVRFVAFVNEEPPYFQSKLMGSRVYAANAASQGDNIIAMFSLETIGYYDSRPRSQHYPFPFNFFYPNRGDFIGFVGNLSSRQLLRRSIQAFRQHTSFPSQGVAAPSWVPGISWSDQDSFWRHGYPAIMLTDTAPFRYPYYHTSRDTIDKLDYPRLARVVGGLAQMIRELARLPAETEPK